MPPLTGRSAAIAVRPSSERLEPNSARFKIVDRVMDPTPFDLSQPSDSLKQSPNVPVLEGIDLFRPSRGLRRVIGNDHPVIVGVAQNLHDPQQIDFALVWEG